MTKIPALWDDFEDQKEITGKYTLQNQVQEVSQEGAMSPHAL